MPPRNTDSQNGTEFSSRPLCAIFAVRTFFLLARAKKKSHLLNDVESDIKEDGMNQNEITPPYATASSFALSA
jgi:hypothetical protein